VEALGVQHFAGIRPGIGWKFLDICICTFIHWFLGLVVGVSDRGDVRGRGGRGVWGTPLVWWGRGVFAGGREERGFPLYPLYRAGQKGSTPLYLGLYPGRGPLYFVGVGVVSGIGGEGVFPVPPVRVEGPSTPPWRRSTGMASSRSARR